MGFSALDNNSEALKRRMGINAAQCLQAIFYLHILQLQNSNCDRIDSWKYLHVFSERMSDFSSTKCLLLPQEQHPGHFGQEFATGSREILETRYWLLPYLYTLFHQVHTQGGTVVRPLHHEYAICRHMPKRKHFH